VLGWVRGTVSWEARQWRRGVCECAETERESVCAVPAPAVFEALSLSLTPLPFISHAMQCNAGGSSLGTPAPAPAHRTAAPEKYWLSTACLEAALPGPFTCHANTWLRARKSLMASLHRQPCVHARNTSLPVRSGQGKRSGHGPCKNVNGAEGNQLEPQPACACPVAHHQHYL
jgi:hypothetical protein